SQKPGNWPAPSLTWKGEVEIARVIRQSPKAATKPVAKPAVVKQLVTKPVAEKPVSTKAVVSNPVVTKPVATKPAKAGKVVDKPEQKFEDELMAVAEQLIIKGKEQGYLTPDDILQGFPEIDAEPDQIFRIFAAFKEI